MTIKKKRGCEPKLRLVWDESRTEEACDLGVVGEREKPDLTPVAPGSVASPAAPHLAFTSRGELDPCLPLLPHRGHSVEQMTGKTTVLPSLLAEWKGFGTECQDLSSNPFLSRPQCPPGKHRSCRSQSSSWLDVPSSSEILSLKPWALLLSLFPVFVLLLPPLLCGPGDRFRSVGLPFLSMSPCACDLGHLIRAGADTQGKEQSPFFGDCLWGSWWHSVKSSLPGTGGLS